MSEPFVFDSRSTLYKDPFGAATCGQTITFRCRPLTADGLVTVRYLTETGDVTFTARRWA